MEIIYLGHNHITGQSVILTEEEYETFYPEILSGEIEIECTETVEKRFDRLCYWLDSRGVL